MLVQAEAATAGVGIVQLPTMILIEAFADGRLVPVLEGWAPPREIIHAVFPSRRGLLPAVCGFIDHLAEQFESLNEG